MVTLLGPSGCGKTTICAWSPGWRNRATGRYSLMAKTSPIVPSSSVTSAWCSSLMPCSRTCRWGKRRLWPEDARHSARRSESARTGSAGDGGSGGVRRSLCRSDLRRPTAARGARALILKPKVLLFDEPLSNLDANLRRSMREKSASCKSSLISRRCTSLTIRARLSRSQTPCW